MYREKWEPGIVHCGLPVYFVIMIMMEVTRKGRACIPEHCAKKPKMFKSKCLKSKQKKKNSMTGPGHSNTYRSLPGGQVFSSCYFHVFIHRIFHVVTFENLSKYQDTLITSFNHSK